MSDFTDNYEAEIIEMFEGSSRYGADSEAAETFLGHLDNHGISDMDEAEETISDFDDNYRGTAASEADFAESIVSDLYEVELDNLPDILSGHIGWDSVWESDLRYDFDSYELPSGGYGFVLVY